MAGAAAQSKQILPTNLNVAPSLFSVGSNDGGVTQGNASSANANAQNDNHSFQGNGASPAEWGQPQSMGGLWSLGIHEREDGLVLGLLGAAAGRQELPPSAP